MRGAEDARTAVLDDEPAKGGFALPDQALLDQHYEVWACTPTNATIVGRAHTLLGALTLYIRARRAERDRTISLLENVLPPDRSA